MKLIGIDPGTHTGIARWDCLTMAMLECCSMPLHRAMEYVRLEKPDVVIFEDARKRRAFGHIDAEQAKYGAAVREGAGAAKRDASIWDDYLTDIGVPFEARMPKETKHNAHYFRACTGFAGKTNEHGRDAGMLITGYNLGMAKSLLTAALQHQGLRGA